MGLQEALYQVDCDDDASVESTVTTKSSATVSTRARPSPYNLRARPPVAPKAPTVPTPTTTTTTTTATPVATSRDAQQIERDCQRCTWHLLTGTQRTQRLQMDNKRHKKVARLIARKQNRLGRLINWTLLESYAVMARAEDAGDSESGSFTTSAATVATASHLLHYYQGYHDVACIFLSTLGGTSAHRVAGGTVGAPQAGLDLAAAVLLRVSQSHFRDCMRPNFASLQTAMRLTMLPLIAATDPAVHDYLQQADHTEPFFAISWVLTWFAHDIRDTGTVKRLFDAFLVSHALLPLYMAVAMVVNPVNRVEILETECDFAEVHQTLAGLPKNSSMVGWKYRPGDGYVSDHEEEDDGTLSTGALSLDDDDFLVVEQAGRVHHTVEGFPAAAAAHDTHSLVSTAMSSMEPPTKVPFQDLIDDALGLMCKYPPRKLLLLASRYYGKEQVDRLLHEGAPEGMSMMDDPPAWALQSTAKADWVLKHRARERKTRSTKNRRDRRREKKRARSRSRGASATRGSERMEEAATVDRTTADAVDSQNSIQKYLAENRQTPAVIALGFGEDDDRCRRRQRRFTIAGAVAVAVVAMVIGVVLQNREQVPLLQTTGEGPSPEKIGETARKIIATFEKTAAPRDGGSKNSPSPALSDWKEERVPQPVVSVELTPPKASNYFNTKGDVPVPPATSTSSVVTRETAVTSREANGKIIQHDLSQLGDWAKRATTVTLKRAARGLMHLGGRAGELGQAVVAYREKSGKMIQQDLLRLGVWSKSALTVTLGRAARGLMHLGGRAGELGQAVVAYRVESGKIIQQDLSRLGDWAKRATTVTLKRAARGLMHVGGRAGELGEAVVQNHRQFHGWMKGAAGIFEESAVGQACKSLLDTSQARETETGV